MKNEIYKFFYWRLYHVVRTNMNINTFVVLKLCWQKRPVVKLCDALKLWEWFNNFETWVLIQWSCSSIVFWNHSSAISMMCRTIFDLQICLKMPKWSQRKIELQRRTEIERKFSNKWTVQMKLVSNLVCVLKNKNVGLEKEKNQFVYVKMTNPIIIVNFIC